VAIESIQREYVVRGAKPREVYDIVTDYPAYPRFFPDFTGCRVLERDGGRQRVEFVAKVVVEVRYVLDILHDEEKLTTSWTFVEGKVVSDSVGGWSFFPQGEDTLIKYRAGLAVKAPLPPKFVINKISNALMGTSIPAMFKALDREVGARRARR
jgi:ribosome-associated toxin RatA of RatAB toxin-antitoxin module